jgi:hypothetical protein
MPSKDIDIIIVVTPTEVSATISDTHKRILEKTLSFSSEEKEISSQFIPAADTVQQDTFAQTIERFYDLTDQAIKGLDAGLAEIESRAEGFDYIFNPEIEFDLSNYTIEIFDGAPGDRVTFSMYKEALNNRIEIDKQIGLQQQQSAGI